MKPELPLFDAADYLDTPEGIAAFLSDAFESGHAGVISDALDAVARAKGLMNRAGAPVPVGRADFCTVLQALSDAGVKLQATAAA